MDLIPYVEMNGERTLTDDFLAYAFDEMVIAGHLSDVFEGVVMRNAVDFINLMKNPVNLPVFGIAGSSLVGFAWLNGVGINHAYGHFCYLQNEAISSVEFGKKILNYWFSMPSSNTPSVLAPGIPIKERGPFLDVILGTVPSFNQKASHYVQKLGFTKLGEIPSLYMNPFTGERWASMIHYLERSKWVSLTTGS